MGRKSKCFRHNGYYAIHIPLKSAERIGLAPGCEITVILNSNDELRIKRLGEPVVLVNKKLGIKGNIEAKLSK